MKNENFEKIITPVTHWTFLGIPLLFVIGSPLHFIYAWTGKCSIVGIFAPVSESIWEHLKLAFWPMLAWWIIGYFIVAKKNKISSAQWFVSATVALYTAVIVIITFFYTYTGAFGFETIVLDVFSLLLAIYTGHLLALHIFRRATFIKGLYWQNIAIALILLLAVLFAVFTFFAPHIPLFRDSTTGTYGV